MSESPLTVSGPTKWEYVRAIGRTTRSLQAVTTAGVGQANIQLSSGERTYGKCADHESTAHPSGIPQGEPRDHRF